MTLRMNMSFDDIFSDGLLKVDRVKELLLYCGSDENSTGYLNDRGRKKLNLFKEKVFDIVLSGYEDDSCSRSKAISEDELRLKRICLRCFANAANRSTVLQDCITVDCIMRFRVMLRIDALRSEVLAVIVSVCRRLHKAGILSEDYVKLKCDLIDLWNHNDSTPDQRSWISAYIAVLLEEDFAFLADCLAEMNFATFDALLVIVDALADHSETGQKNEIHPNNARLCVDLIERIEHDLSASIAGSERTITSRENFEFVHRLTLLVSVIASSALYRPQLDDVFHSDAHALTLIVQILEAVVEYDVERENAQSRVDRAPDRPTQPLLPHREMANSSPFVKALSTALQSEQITQEEVAELKCSCVRAIGNLCCDSPVNRVCAGNLDCITLILHCSRRLSYDATFTQQWAIATLRFMCMECRANQERLAQISSVPSEIIDRDRLLQQLGLAASIDPVSGRVTLTPAKL
ncbi:hypothetical protein AB6A40_008315 [Gnathostoma spinigerum]|uniref:Ataxin-10 n=1 Tax=Gnathostoma spinigerum TaxID=75299 RepID=A0ABD6EP51_9BILA